MSAALRSLLLSGLAIPAHPLALNASRRLDERRQRALSRYYIAAGAGGLAVGVHTTQFAIRDPKHGLFKPVLQLAAEEMNRAARPLVRIAGVCGPTKQAVAEAQLLRELGYHAALLSLAALQDADPGPSQAGGAGKALRALLDQLAAVLDDGIHEAELIPIPSAWNRAVRQTSTTRFRSCTALHATCRLGASPP